MEKEPNKEGASEQTPSQPSATTPTTPSVAPKVEVKDGAILVDGKKMVPESDLIAAKKSLEGQIEEAQSAHNEAIDKAKLDLSKAQTDLASANAKVQNLETAQKNAVAESPEDTAKREQAIKDAQAKADTSSAKIMDLRVKNITLQYPGQVTEEQLKGKTPEQLDAFEEAMKALSTSRGGPGPYALPGAGGSAAPLSDEDRAKAILAATPVRGVRNAPPNQPEK